MKTLVKILCLCLFWVSCDEEDSSSFENFSYPLNIGNIWIYEGDFIVESHFDSLSVLYMTSLDSIIVDSMYVDTLISQNNIYRLKNINTSMVNGEEVENDFNWGYDYFSNLPNGLTYLGYSNPGGGGNNQPWSNLNDLVYRFNNIYFSESELLGYINRITFNSREDYWEEPPLVSIKYPIYLNDQWEYRPIENPWKMDKKIIEVNNQNFKIQILYDFDNDNNWDENFQVFQTFSNEGLIGFEFNIDSLEVIDVDGNIIGYQNRYYNSNLIEIFINP